MANQCYKQQTNDKDLKKLKKTKKKALTTVQLSHRTQTKNKTTENNNRSQLKTKQLKEEKNKRTHNQWQSPSMDTTN